MPSGKSIPITHLIYIFSTYLISTLFICPLPLLLTLLILVTLKFFGGISKPLLGGIARRVHTQGTVVEELF